MASATPSWKVPRRVLASLNLAAVLALLTVLFIFVNFIASRRYARWEVSRQRITQLSPRTRQALAGLSTPVSIMVFYRPSHRLYELLKDQLQEYKRVQPALIVEYIDPDQDVARAQQLAREFSLGRGDLNIVIVAAGTRHQQIPETELAEYDYSAMEMGGEPRVSAFKGEEALTAAIIQVTQGVAPKLWFTSGHGEKALEGEDNLALSGLAQTLKKQGMAAEAVTLAERTEVPADVSLVVIAGPTHRFTEPELLVLQAYLERGGKLLALIDPAAQTGLDGLLARWGIELGLDFVVDPARRIPFVSAGNLLVTDYTDHPVVGKMQTLLTLFPLARSVRPVEPPPDGVTVTTLAMTSPDGWGETREGKVAEFTPGEDLKGPVPIAVAAERRASPSDAPGAEGAPGQNGATGKALARLLVVGDSEFIVNAQVSNAGNQDFALGAIYWLTEQERLIGIGPKRLESAKLHLTGPQVSGLFQFGFFGLPAVFALLGVAVWWLRRQ